MPQDSKTHIIDAVAAATYGAEYYLGRAPHSAPPDAQNGYVGWDPSYTGLSPILIEVPQPVRLELPEDVERRLHDQVREAVRRELETHRHAVRTELVQRGRPWQCAEHALPGELDARPGDKVQAGGHVWRVVDRLHRVDAMTLTLWVEPT